MRAESLQFLRNLVNTPSPVGHETRGLRVWLDYAQTYSNATHSDAYGNCVATLNPGAGPRLMLAAHADLKRGKVYTGDFARAVRHQRYAVFLWRRGFYARSIHHSRRARMLAINVIQANKGTVQPSYKMDKEEDSLSKNTPPDSQLDTDLKNDTEFSKNAPATSDKDEDFINIMVDDIDLTDLE
jgi:hypothetical protein